MRLLKFCLLSVIISVITACGGGNDNPGLINNPVNSGTKNPPIDLIGEWETHCNQKKLKFMNLEARYQ